MDPTSIVTAGALASLILEGLKWIFRLVVVKDPDYEFPAKLYLVAIPVLTFLVQPLLALLGISGYTMPTDWIGWLKEAVVILLSSLMALLTHTLALSPLIEYGRYKRLGVVEEE